MELGQLVFLQLQWPECVSAGGTQLHLIRADSTKLIHVVTSRLFVADFTTHSLIYSLILQRCLLRGVNVSHLFLLSIFILLKLLVLRRIVLEIKTLCKKQHNCF